MHADLRRVLLVEDDEDDYYLTRDVIDSIGSARHEIVWCDTFERACDALVDQRFDIAFIDYRIGAKTGVEFVQKAKADGIDVPMVLLTGLRDAEIDIAASEAGATDYLNKDQLEPDLVERTIRYACANAAAQRSVIERSGLLQTTLDNTGSGIAALDASDRVVAYNSSFVEMVDQLSPRLGPAALHFKASDEASLQSVIDEILRTIGGENPEQKELLTLDDLILEISINKTEGGGSIIVIHDITEQRLFELNLTRAKDEAEAASRSKTAFLATISHELRTPLNAIIGFSEIILSEARGVHELADYKEDAALIHENGYRLLNMVNEILEFSQVEAGDYKIDKEEIELGSEMDYCLRNIQPQAEAAGVRVEADDQGFNGPVYADAAAFRRIVGNILSNAVKFTPEGGLVSLSTRLQEDGSCSLVVTDTGCGIPKSDLSLVVRPFYQVQQDNNRAYEGLGLGLTVVDALSKLQGAKVKIDSVLGEGTKVAVTFPRGAIAGGADEAVPDNVSDRKIA